MKLEKDKNLVDESSFNWGEIVRGTLKFDRMQSEVSICIRTPLLHSMFPWYFLLERYLSMWWVSALTWNISPMMMTQVAALRTVTQQELIDFFDDNIKVGAPRRKSLSVQVYGRLHSAEFQAAKCNADKTKSVLIDEIFSFRRSQPLYGSLRGGFDHMKLWVLHSLKSSHERKRKWILSLTRLDAVL